MTNTASHIRLGSIKDSMAAKKAVLTNKKNGNMLMFQLRNRKGIQSTLIPKTSVETSDERRILCNSVRSLDPIGSD